MRRQTRRTAMAKVEIYARDIKTPDDLKDFIDCKQVELGMLRLKAGIPGHYKYHTFDLCMFRGKSDGQAVEASGPQESSGVLRL